MDTYGEDTIGSELVNRYIRVKGGQNPDGSQKPGFFMYKGMRPIGIFDGEYKLFKEADQPDWFETASKELKAEAPAKDANLEQYFKNLASSTTESAEIARNYLLKSAEIAEGLVADSVANSVEDVTKILKTGFAHKYGPTEYAPLMRVGE